MGTEVHQFTATIPAGTLASALASVPAGVGNLTVERIDLHVPPGPSGVMGFFLACSGQQFLPFEAGEFLVWDDIRDSWDLTGQITTGAWSVEGYNTGAYPHSVYVTFHCSPIATASPTSPPSVTIITSPQGPTPTPTPTPSPSPGAGVGGPGGSPAPSGPPTPAPSVPGTSAGVPTAGGCSPAPTPGATPALLAAQLGTTL